MDFGLATPAIQSFHTQSHCGLSQRLPEVEKTYNALISMMSISFRWVENLKR